MNSQSPNYKLIFADILEKKYPEKTKNCEEILHKDNLSTLDILALNQIIFGITDKQSEEKKQKHRSYKKTDVFHILDYQKKYKLNNSNLAKHFKISRNTVSKWRKMFLV